MLVPSASAIEDFGPVAVVAVIVVRIHKELRRRSVCVSLSLSIYLEAINIFLAVLQLLSGRRRD